MSFTFNFPSFQKIARSFGFSESIEDSISTELSASQDGSDRTTKTSLGTPTSSPGPLPKRSFVDITMKITEAAEDIFLFGSGQYHERPAKRRRLDPKTGQPQDATGGAPLPDFQLNGEAVWHYAQASPSLLDNDDS